jgi:hypothetical protein
LPGNKPDLESRVLFVEALFPIMSLAFLLCTVNAIFFLQLLPKVPQILLLVAFA